MKDFLFTLLAWLFTLPFLIGSVAFAFYNSETQSVILNPFQPPVTLPLYVPVLVALAIGFFFGALMTWAAMGRQRHERRQLRQQVQKLERELTEKEVRLENSPGLVQTLPLRLLGRK